MVPWRAPTRTLCTLLNDTNETSEKVAMESTQILEAGKLPSNPTSIAYPGPRCEATGEAV